MVLHATFLLPRYYLVKGVVTGYVIYHYRVTIFTSYVMVLILACGLRVGYRCLEDVAFKNHVYITNVQALAGF